MKVIVLRPLERPVVEEIPDGAVLEGLQALVGGFVDVRRLSPEIDMWFDDEGRLKSREPNRRVGPWDIVGPLVLTRRKGSETIGLTPEDIAEWMPQCSRWPILVAIPASVPSGDRPS